MYGFYKYAINPGAHNSNLIIIRLEVSGFGTLETADFGAMAQAMGGLLEENVKDPELRKWLIPSTH